MTTAATIPVTFSPEASARIAQLGFQSEVNRMIEHAQQFVTRLKRIDVILEDAYETWDQPFLTIYAVRDEWYPPEDRTERELGRWRVTTFPPEVCTQVAILVNAEPGHAG